VLFDKFSYPSDLNPNWKAGSGGAAVSYMPWQVYDLTYAPAELGPGDTLTLDVVAAGCSGAVTGYIYIDDSEQPSLGRALLHHSLRYP